MATNNSLSRFISPAGEAEYPWLNTPDTKFNPDGDYKVNLVVDDTPEARKLIAKLEAILDNHMAKDEAVQKAKKAKKAVAKADTYEEQEDGRLVFKFKQKAIIRTKDGKEFEKKVRLFDAKGKPIDDVVGRGSVLKVCFEVMPYFMQTTKTVGLSLKPLACQVIDLKSSSGEASAEGYGFGEEEGYTSDSFESATDGAMEEDHEDATAESIESDDF